MYFTVSTTVYLTSLGILKTSHQVDGRNKKEVQKDSVLAYR